MTESSRGEEVRDRAEKKERDPESVNRSKRRRSERFTRRDVEEEGDSSDDESMGEEEEEDVKHSNERKRLPSSSRIADGMIGVPVPRKARSGFFFIFYLFIFFCLSDFFFKILSYLIN